MNKGEIKLITGPMFAGKSSLLLSELQKVPSDEILAINYFLDNRYGKEKIATHDGKNISSKSVKKSMEIIELLKENTKISTLGLDELQFFDKDISNILKDLKKQGLSIITSGLDLDHNNKEWETTKRVKRIADEIIILTAVCAMCGQKNAVITNRKGRRDERIVVGGTELYESLCEKDYLKINSNNGQ